MTDQQFVQPNGNITDAQEQRPRFNKAAVPFPAWMLRPEPEPNTWKCQAGIPHGQGSCPDCPS